MRRALVPLALVLAAAGVAAARQPPALPEVDLAKLEPVVAEQISSLQQWAAERLADSGALAAARAEAVGELGQLYHAYELREPAAACYEIARDLAPGDFRWPYLLGYLHQKSGRLESATQLYERALAIRPLTGPALVRLGEVYAARGLPDAAERNLRAALAADPTNAAAEAVLGELLVAQRRYREAIALLLSALDKVPEAERLYYSLAMAHRGLGEVDRARELLDKSGPVGVRPSDPLIDGLAALTTGERVHVLRGRAAYAAGRFREAAAEFARAVEIDSDSIPARVNLGSALAALGESAAAAQEFGRVVELAPANLAALYNLGSLAAAAGDLEAAVAWFHEAVRYNPDDVASRVRLGQSLQAIGQHPAALQQLRRALELDPANEDALLGEAAALVGLRRYLEALGRLEEAHARVPASGRIAHALARMLSSCPRAELRDGERAVALAERVFAARPTPAHGATLAEALAEAGRCDEAAELARQIVDLLREADPDGRLAATERALALYEAGPPCRPPVAAAAGAG